MSITVSIMSGSIAKIDFSSSGKTFTTALISPLNSSMPAFIRSGSRLMTALRIPGSMSTMAFNSCGKIIITESTRDMNRSIAESSNLGIMPTRAVRTLGRISTMALIRTGRTWVTASSKAENVSMACFRMAGIMVVSAVTIAGSRSTKTFTTLGIISIRVSIIFCLISMNFVAIEPKLSPAKNTLILLDRPSKNEPASSAPPPSPEVKLLNASATFCKAGATWLFIMAAILGKINSTSGTRAAVKVAITGAKPSPMPACRSVMLAFSIRWELARPSCVFAKSPAVFAVSWRIRP